MVAIDTAERRLLDASITVIHELLSTVASADTAISIGAVSMMNVMVLSAAFPVVSWTLIMKVCSPSSSAVAFGMYRNVPLSGVNSNCSGSISMSSNVNVIVSGSIWTSSTNIAEISGLASAIVVPWGGRTLVIAGGCTSFLMTAGFSQITRRCTCVTRPKKSTASTVIRFTPSRRNIVRWNRPLDSTAMNVSRILSVCTDLSILPATVTYGTSTIAKSSGASIVMVSLWVSNTTSRRTVVSDPRGERAVITIWFSPSFKSNCTAKRAHWSDVSSGINGACSPLIVTLFPSSI